MSPKARVIAAHPGAWSSRTRHAGWVVSRPSVPAKIIMGTGRTAQAAWADAASKLGSKR